jgi:hypothetical protein
MKHTLTLLTALLLAPLAALHADAAGEQRVFNVRAFGAAGDGVTLNTAAIQKAIDACAASGGGEVLIAGGKFVTGTIYLKDNDTKLPGDAIRASFHENPMLFFRQIIMPLMPRDLTLRFNDGGVVKWASPLDSFPRPPNLTEPSKQLPPSENPPPPDQLA